MRKEYKDRENAPLVNPGFTTEEYENSRDRKRCLYNHCKKVLPYERAKVSSLCQECATKGKS